MNASSAPSSAAPPTAHVSRSTLTKASLAALVVSGIVTVLFILPAESAVDLTGVGKATGINGMSASEASDESNAPQAAAASEKADISGAVEAHSAWREDIQTIELPPHRGAELKARMKAGDGYAFSWKVNDGKVMVDMHGDPPNAGPDDFTSYWEVAETTSQAGTFVAPFDGVHGWYWRNLGDQPVTVELKISGHYEDIYRP